MPVAATLAVLQALISASTQIPELIAAGKMVVGLIQDGREPTDEEQAVIDAGLEAADKALPSS